MFRQNPVFIVAGEIVRTSRIFAMSVSPLTRPMLDNISPELYERLMACKKGGDLEKEERRQITAERQAEARRKKDEKKAANNAKKASSAGGAVCTANTAADALSLGGLFFETKKIKGKKTALLPLDLFIQAVSAENDKGKLNNAGQMKGVITTNDGGTLLNGEKLSLIIQLTKELDLRPLPEKKWNRKMNVDVNEPIQKEQLIDSLDFILRTAIAKQKGREYGFITLYTNSNGSYWFKVSRGFSTALMESHASLEKLIEENVDFSKEEKERINHALSLVNKLYV